jgi:hypothetical protein
MVAALEGFGSQPTTGEARLTDFVVGKKEVPEQKKKRYWREKRESGITEWRCKIFFSFKRVVDDNVDGVRPHSISIQKGLMMF